MKVLIARIHLGNCVECVCVCVCVYVCRERAIIDMYIHTCACVLSRSVVSNSLRPHGL